MSGASEPRWISPNAVRVVHQLQLDEHGGQEGVRDEGLLDSALQRPRNQWAYAQADLAMMAAVYAHGIAKNHPFIDGNKRTAGVVCDTFLALNGFLVEASNNEWYEAVLGLAAGEVSEQQFAQWLRDHLVESAR